MTKILWGQTGQRRYETGVDRGVLYLLDPNGNYSDGYAWNGLTTVTESPSGAESNKQYADNRVYVNLVSKEEFGATVEAFTYPDEFEQCDGSATPAAGVSIGQQGRRTFGLSYRNLVGNDVDGTDLGYKIHLVYGAQAAPSEKARGTVNDSPEALNMSWELTTTPVDVPGLEPTSHIVVDSTKVSAANLAALEDALYGTAGSDPYLPLPAAVIAMFGGTLTTVETQGPTYDAATDTVTIPSTTGVNYFVDGEPVSGSFTITSDTVVTATPQAGYRFTDESDTDWTINYS